MVLQCARDGDRRAGLGATVKKHKDGSETRPFGVLISGVLL